MTEQEKMVAWAKRNVVMTYVEGHAKNLIQEVLADMVEEDMRRNPDRTMEESARQCALCLRKALNLAFEAHAW